ncbi:MAG: class I SAM-dependent methyltransferase [Bacteroidales bacterium]|nr:class I SAM-dependent methyltransferase [Bacteroidales bacterium]
MKECLICNSQIEPFMSFGQMPLANGFLAPDKFADEYFFELSVASCPCCGMFQLMEQPNREMMFNEHYPFYSGSSKGMAVHFQEFAEHVKKDHLFSTDPFVVEIGSNDGIMLRHFADADIRHLGIEPSFNVAQVAIDNGINTISTFFDEDCASEIVKKYGQADAFLAANVMCHIPCLHSIVKGIGILLKPKGVVMFEDPYLGDVIENTSYDQIYDEHVFLFSLSSISYLFGQHDMEIIDIEPQETHGGSMRYVIARKGMHPVSERVHIQLEKEKSMGLNNPETYELFRKDCEHSRESLMALLQDLRRQGKRIIGYAATSKSTTILNYCGIGPDLIEFISDTTPIKQGKFSPGAHIPILPYEEFLVKYPDYALLFAYNHAKEIMAKEQKFMASGGKWIMYVPEVKVL